jgi:hypothetical protein
VVAHPSSKASRTPPAAMGRITRATSALTRPTGDCAPLTTQAMPATPHSVGGNSLALAATTPHPVAEKQTAAKTTARKRNKRQASTKAAAAGAEAPAEVVEATAWPEPSEAVLVGDDATATEVELAAEAPKRRRARRQQDPPPLNDLPTPEYVARLRAQGYQPPPLPVPNLGYACLNTVMRACKPPIFTSRRVVGAAFLVLRADGRVGSPAASLACALLMPLHTAAARLQGLHQAHPGRQGPALPGGAVAAELQGPGTAHSM